MAIDVFFGAVPRHASERRVLKIVVDKLTAIEEQAVILADFICGDSQIDLVIGTPRTTLIVEIKSYGAPVFGSKNGKWGTTAKGRSRGNGYRQALDAAHMLKDALTSFTGSAQGYAHAVVLFEEGIPAGSQLNCSDFKVTVCGIEELDGLLSKPVRYPWNLDSLRAFALHHDLRPIDEFRAVNSRARIADVVHEEPDLSSERATYPVERIKHSGLHEPGRLTAKQISIAQYNPPPGFYNTANTRPRRSRVRPIAIVIACASVAVVAMTFISKDWRHVRDGGIQATTMKSRPPEPTSRLAVRHRHAVTHKSSGYEIAGGNLPMDRPFTAKAHPSGDVDNSEAVQDNSPAKIDAPSVITGAGPAVPPCPHGIDRLGCVPDAETLAKLRER